MSLESEIKTLTAAVQQLTEALRNQVQMPLALEPAPVITNTAPPVEQKAVVEVAADNSVTITPVAATLEDCKAAFRVWTKQYSHLPPKEQHAHGAALLERFGAKKLPDLKTEDYAAFVAACAEGGA